MQKQYIVQKYVMAESVAEAIQKSRALPIHEVFVHNSHFEKELNFSFFSQPKNNKKGFKTE